MTRAQTKAQERYDRDNTVKYSMKLNVKTDADIIAWLQGRNIQGSMKAAIREYMKREGAQ